MTYTSETELRGDLFHVEKNGPMREVLLSIAKDPDAPLWALWEVYRFSLHCTHISGELYADVCISILFNPAMDLLLLEDPWSAQLLVQRCESTVQRGESSDA